MAIKTDPNAPDIQDQVDAYFEHQKLEHVKIQKKLTGVTPPPYEFREFPKMKHHPEKDSVVVHNPDQENALGEGFTDTPQPKAVFNKDAEIERLQLELMQLKRGKKG